MDMHPEIPEWRKDHCERWGLRFIEAAPMGAAHDDVLALRSQMYGIPLGDAVDEVDDYSTLYCAYARGVPVGTMRVTAAANGRLDCEEFYPAALLDGLRGQVGSASRFAVRQDLPPGMQVARLLIEVAWLDQVRRGIRLDVINAHRRALRYYERIGYRPLAGSFFLHPRLNTPSYVMVSAADPSEGPLRQLFRGIENPLRFEVLDRFVGLTTASGCVAEKFRGNRNRERNRHGEHRSRADTGHGDLVLSGAGPALAGWLPRGAVE